MQNFFISSPDWSDDDFRMAVNVIRLCTKKALPEFGFSHPFVAPGGQYGNMWWQLDFSIALTGLRWIGQKEALSMFMNFETAKKPDGRIPLWGNDELPDFNNGKPLQRNGTSSFPRLFDAAAKLSAGCDDPKILRRFLKILTDYLQWWSHDRQDPETMLFSAVFEETFIPYYGHALEYAPVDLNVEIIHGYRIAADLADRIGEHEMAVAMRTKADELKTAVARWLWNEKQQLFAPMMLKDCSSCQTRMAGSFAALRFDIANAPQKKAMIAAMTDPRRFGWGSMFLTSVDRTDPAFTVIPDGHAYNGNPCWSGSIWATLNENAVRGLLDSGENTLAAELANHTLKIFRKQYCEFLNPDTGNACGVMEYAWTAAICVDLFFAVICGICYDAQARTLTVRPNLPPSYAGKKISIRGLRILDRSISLDIQCGPVPSIRLNIGAEDILYGYGSLTCCLG